ncbi:prepilin-type N-terminal cleavage/methylation domain-containing protein [Candidatus Omnitrophota bacterium]
MKKVHQPTRTSELKRGFSLLELIIAIGVLAIGLVGVLQIFPVGLRASYRSGMMTKAALLAKNKIEEVKMAGFLVIIEELPKIPLSGTEGDFDWEIFIDEVDLDGLGSSDDIRKLTVTVSWAERNKIRSKDFMTYVTR